MKDSLDTRKQNDSADLLAVPKDQTPSWQGLATVATHGLLVVLALFVTIWAIPSSGRESAEATRITGKPAAINQLPLRVRPATGHPHKENDRPAILVPPQQQPTMIVTLPQGNESSTMPHQTARTAPPTADRQPAGSRGNVPLPGAGTHPNGKEQVAWIEPGTAASDFEATLTTRAVPQPAVSPRSAIVEPTLTPNDGRTSDAVAWPMPVEPMPEDGATSATPGWFYGLPAGQRTVYVIDASGSLIDTLPFALIELRRAIASLNEQHAYSVLFFSGDGLLEAPPSGMVRAIDTAKNSTLEWLSPDRHNVIAAGRADPLAAIRQALSHQPDTVILLSDSITSIKDPSGDRQRLLELIKPVADTTRFHTIQFIDPDPTAAPGRVGTLELIAQATGGRHRHLRIDDARPILTPTR